MAYPPQSSPPGSPARPVSGAPSVDQAVFPTFKQKICDLIVAHRINEMALSKEEGWDKLLKHPAPDAICEAYYRYISKRILQFFPAVQEKLIDFALAIHQCFVECFPKFEKYPLQRQLICLLQIIPADDIHNGNTCRAINFLESADQSEEKIKESVMGFYKELILGTDQLDFGIFSHRICYRMMGILATNYADFGFEYRKQAVLQAFNRYRHQVPADFHTQGYKQWAMSAKNQDDLKESTQKLIKDVLLDLPILFSLFRTNVKYLLPTHPSHEMAYEIREIVFPASEFSKQFEKTGLLTDFDVYIKEGGHNVIKLSIVREYRYRLMRVEDREHLKFLISDFSDDLRSVNDPGKAEILLQRLQQYGQVQTKVLQEQKRIQELSFDSQVYRYYTDHLQGKNNVLKVDILPLYQQQLYEEAEPGWIDIALKLINFVYLGESSLIQQAIKLDASRQEAGCSTFKGAYQQLSTFVGAHFKREIFSEKIIAFLTLFVHQKGLGETLKLITEPQKRWVQDPSSYPFMFFKTINTRFEGFSDNLLDAATESKFFIIKRENNFFTIMQIMEIDALVTQPKANVSAYPMLNGPVGDTQSLTYYIVSPTKIIFSVDIEIHPRQLKFSKATAQIDSADDRMKLHFMDHINIVSQLSLDERKETLCSTDFYDRKNILKKIHRFSGWTLLTEAVAPLFMMRL